VNYLGAPRAPCAVPLPVVVFLRKMDPPSISVTGEDGSNSDLLKKTVKFQCGLLRETESFSGDDLDILCGDTLLYYVCDMLNNKVSSSAKVLDCRCD
jgi:hypothetical protein